MLARQQSSGFALIHLVLLVTAAILLITSFATLVNPPGKAAQAMDNQRKYNLSLIKQALDSYAANHNGQYPATDNSSSFADFNNHQPQCFQCGIKEYQQSGLTDVPYNKDNWIPQLVDQGYLPTLPVDPQTGDDDTGLCLASGWPRGYIYYSDGTNYKLVDFCGPTTGLNLVAGHPSPYCVGDPKHLQPQPVDQPALKDLVDPKQPSFNFAVYTPGWACF
jgi:type II secretory pathway pseudopilin PulG